MFRVKICGLTRREDVQAAIDAGADAVGFVLAPSSPRYVTLAQAERLLDVVPDGVLAVAVAKSVLVETGDLPFDVVQGRAPRSAPGILPVVSGGSHLAAHVDKYDDIVLVDASHGRGRLVSLPGSVELHRPFLLAGGLNSDNVADVIRRARPHGVDVSSGVESSRGCKDAALFPLFVNRALAALQEVRHDGARLRSR